MKYEKLHRNIIDIITEIFNTMCEGFPESWKLGIMHPLYKGIILCKKGERIYPRNYRGITLLNTLYKVQASIILEKLKIS